MISARNLVVAALLAAGCGRYRAVDLPQEPAHTRANSQQRSGLLVAADLVVDPRVSELYLGPGFHEAGFFAVVVSLENRGSDSFEIERQQFAVVLETGERFEPVPPTTVFEELRRSPVNVATVLLAPLIFPVVLIADDVQEYNFELARNLSQKALRSALRLETGAPPTSKALFFRKTPSQPDPIGGFDSSVLQFMVEIEGARPEAATDEELTVGKRITFTVTLNRKEI